jgi:hypothetical protein
MRVPFESRMLLSLASALAPPPLRENWRREWEAEVWWWTGSRTGGRLELAAHCSGALSDAAYLRYTHTDLPAWAAGFRRAPAACLAVLALSIVAVITGSGLSETRRLMRGEPFAGRRIAVLSQSLAFMGAHYGVPVAKFADWNARAQSIDGAALFVHRGGVVYVGPKFFEILGTKAALGTLSGNGAVISYSAWRKQFRGARAAMKDAGVIGVLPRDFWFLGERADVWMLSLPADLKQASAIARLKPGFTPAQARNELRELAAQVRPASSGMAVIVEPILSLSARPVTTLGLPWLSLVIGVAVASGIAFRRSPRYAAYLALKSALTLTLVLLATIEFGSSWMTINSGETNLGAGVASLWLFLAGPAAALYWCWRDQSLRCRICLHRLAMPVTFGEGARILLERAGTELMCSNGHGTLITGAGADPASQWEPMDGSWRELFVNK